MVNTPEEQPDVAEWIQQYEADRPRYEQFAEKLAGLIKELLTGKNIRFQAVESRAKTVESVRAKTGRPEKGYANPLEEITDLAGIRVVLYYVDDVDRVCELVDNEFSVDEVRSVDKRTELEVDQFGYLSVHKIVKLHPKRRSLAEWEAFKDLRAEVQIRTVLQHAWAAISHTLQYKREADIPAQYRRKLVRLASLLELADEEFGELRKAETEVEREVQGRLKHEDTAIPINAISLREYVRTSSIVKDLAKSAGSTNWHILFEWEPTEDYSDLSELCQIVGVRNIQMLDSIVKKLAPSAPAFFKAYPRELAIHGTLSAAPVYLLHWLVTGANLDKIDDTMARKLGWVPDYFAAFVRAARGTLYSD